MSALRILVPIKRVIDYAVSPRPLAQAAAREQNWRAEVPKTPATRQPTIEALSLVSAQPG